MGTLVNSLRNCRGDGDKEALCLFRDAISPVEKDLWEEGDSMIDADALVKVRRALESNIGERVMLKANRGRKKTFIKEGIIEDTYPNVFTVVIDIDSRAVQRLSYTYSDVLTSTVELVVCSSNVKIYA